MKKAWSCLKSSICTCGCKKIKEGDTMISFFFYFIVFMSGPDDG